MSQPDRQPFLGTALRLGRKTMLMLAAAILMLAAGQTHAARVALVIGNANYAKSPLLNPLNDAKAISAKLRALKFKVTEVLDLKRNDIGITIERFLGQISRGDSALFFYAGHGVQVDGRNYLLAVDAALQSQYDVPLNAIDVTRFLGRLENTGANVKLMFLDACRDNPFMSRFRGGGDRGLARMGNAPNGTLISFATRPGGVAADGDGSNGLYTSHLLRYIDQPDLAIEQMLKKVAAATIASSEGKQSPWIEGGITGNFVFKTSPPVLAKPAVTISPSTLVAPRTSAVPTQTAAEQAAWKIAQANDSELAFDLFLREYPTSQYAPAARMKIALQQAKDQQQERQLKQAALARSHPRETPIEQKVSSENQLGAQSLSQSESQPTLIPRPALATIGPSVAGGRVYQASERSLWEVTLTRTSASVFIDRLVYLGEIGNGGGFDPQPPHEFVCSSFGIAIKNNGMIEPTVCRGSGGRVALSGRINRLRLELSDQRGYRERFAIPLISPRPSAQSG